MIKINGEDKKYEPCTVNEILAKEGYNLNRIAVEINKGIISKKNYDKVIVQDDDVIEVIRFVGGG